MRKTYTKAKQLEMLRRVFGVNEATLEDTLESILTETERLKRNIKELFKVIRE